MKLSSKGRYGVRALFDIALHADEGPTQIKDISVRQAIPPRFLEQIFQDLRRAGIVTSRRGPRGGYQLARDPRDIRIGDVVRVLDGPIGEFAGERPSSRLPIAARETRRVTDDVFRDLGRAVEACFDRVSIADVVEKARHSGVHPKTSKPLVYAI
jgi:Rrf2 family protein